jgi:predicted secreted hydrolase
MDREWSSRPLAATQKGWDWFSLHFASGDKLIVYRLRDETVRGFCAGTWIHADGTTQTLDRDDIALTPLSQISLHARTLPIRWKLTVKSHALDVETTPVNADSWMATRFAYWEGPIFFSGSHQGKGYLEMTGY